MEGDKGFSGRDIAILVLSLLLSFGVWLIHNLSLNYRQVVSVPIIAQSTLPGHAFRASSASLVKAGCHSSGFRLIRLSAREDKTPVSVTFSASDLTHKGGDIYYITASNLRNYIPQIFGEGVAVEAFLSDTLLFRFPYQDSRRLPVEAVADITCKAQYMQSGEIVFSPDSVTVFGEPSLLQSLSSVKTAPITLADVDSKVFSSVALQKIQGLRFSADVVDYSFDVVRYVEIVSNVTIGARGVPSGKNLIIYPSTARLVMRCRFPVSADMHEPVLFVDYNDFRSSLKGQCVAQIDNVPEGVLSVSVEPEVFECVEVSLW